MLIFSAGVTVCGQAEWELQEQSVVNVSVNYCLGNRPRQSQRAEDEYLITDFLLNVFTSADKDLSHQVIVFSHCQHGSKGKKAI